MKKQTAVEFAVEKLEKLIPSGNQLVIGAILEEAKKMEKEQIMNAFMEGDDSDYTQEEEVPTAYAKQYYNETYGKK